LEGQCNVWVQLFVTSSRRNPGVKIRCPWPGEMVLQLPVLAGQKVCHQQLWAAGLGPKNTSDGGSPGVVWQRDRRLLVYQRALLPRAWLYRVVTC